MVFSGGKAMNEEGWNARTQMLLGEDVLGTLKSRHVLVVGLGGVGSYAAEMIVRAGIGKLTIVDGDRIHESNINRQLPALHSTKGKYKTEVMQERLLDINPKLNLYVVNEFIKDQSLVNLLEKHHYDYVVDAIDTLTPKIQLIYHALQHGLKLISSMGAGGKMDGLNIKIADISETYNCKLAKMLRKRIHKIGIHKGFKVVFSPELIDPSKVVITPGEFHKKSNVGTISYMPALFGIQCASHVLNELTEGPVQASLPRSSYPDPMEDQKQD